MVVRDGDGRGPGGDLVLTSVVIYRPITGRRAVVQVVQVPLRPEVLQYWGLEGHRQPGARRHRHVRGQRQAVVADGGDVNVGDTVDG